ncbi:hypothetical protein C8Q75DRAFT_709972 [Abortiporus biennis]|nr:hypothetical protein C8Q75DRAFT_709972 [Abortiporus biennis]
MSAPYGYPSPVYQTPYLWPYQPQHVSPFIPTTYLPPSPNAGANTRRVRFEDEQYPDTRPVRPPSWHGTPTQHSSPPIIYTPLSAVMPLPGPPPGFTHQRRHSDSRLPPPQGYIPVSWAFYPTAPAPPPSQFHPLLNAENRQEPCLFFDFSEQRFNPVKTTRPGNTTGTTLSVEELRQQATHPGVTKMVIDIDGLTWPIELEFSRPSSYYLTADHRSNYVEESQPISVGDILIAVHRMLQMQISHADWRRLGDEDARDIARAYTSRCRSYPSEQQFLEAQGVRRVDYLKRKHFFKGLSRVPGNDNFERVRLIMGSP